MTIRFLLLLTTLFVTACGGGGSSNSNTVPNQPPSASFITTVIAGTDPLTVHLDASASSDSDGSITNYHWTFGDTTSGSGITTSHTFGTVGSYTITLTVTDDDEASHSLAHTIDISSNVIARISLGSAANGALPHTVTFDASGSEVLGATGGQPAIISYQWNFGDGATGAGAVVNHTYTSLGTFTATLVVTDSSGDTDTATVTIQTAFTLSGNISTASGSVVDIDVNDPSRQNKNNPATVFQTNDTTLEAQALPNPTHLNGFISATGAGAPPSGVSNFASTGDTDDYYSAHLLAGQFVSLQVSDFNASAPTSVDIDLLLYNSDQTLISFSDSTTAFESIAITTEGDYFIRVRAISGISKYVMNIGTTSLVTGLTAYGKSANFITGQAIVKMKPAGLRANLAAGMAPVAALSHNDSSRPALARFAIPAAQPRIASPRQQANNPQTNNTAAIDAKNHARLATLDHIKQLNARADVEYAEPNYRVYAQRIPNDNFYYLQAHYPQINLPQAWDISTGEPATGSVVVAVIDSGVVLSHEDLAGKFVSADDDYDFISDVSSSADGDGIDPDPDDPGDGGGAGSSSWHGTHVAGTIAAASNNNRGVSGVSWGARIMPIRVLGRDGGSNYDVEQGVRFAAGLSNDSLTVPSKRADIINLSLGGSGFSQASQALYNQVRDAGVIVIASAGNQSTTEPSYPASYDGVISVSAVDLNNNLAPYSNTGAFIDVTAPGGDLSVDSNADGYGDGILSTLIDEVNGNRNASYQFYQGTSMAAPHVAGVAALMKAIYPALTPADFDASLQAGRLTDDIGSEGFDQQFGFGVINALKSVQQAQLLAGGSATGSMLSSPTRVDFGAVLTSRTLTLTQVGSSPPAVTSVTKTAPWLHIDSSNAAANGSGDYTLTVERALLSDAIYVDNVVFALDNGNNLTVPVSMQVQNTVNNAGDAGFLYILLLDANTLDFVAQLNLDVNDGQYAYSFNNVPFGEYFIIAGSDVDNDFIICGSGESCGRYPTNDQPQRIVVNRDMSNLDFLASVVSSAISTAQTGSNNDRGIARGHATTVEPVNKMPDSHHKTAH